MLFNKVFLLFSQGPGWPGETEATGASTTGERVRRIRFFIFTFKGCSNERYYANVPQSKYNFFLDNYGWVRKCSSVTSSRQRWSWHAPNCWNGSFGCQTPKQVENW